MIRAHLNKPEILVALGIVALALIALLLGAPDVLAAGDPSKIGDNAYKVVSPNVKAFWKIGVLVGIVALFITRKYNVVGPFLGLLLLAGVIIYNPAGLGDMVDSVANKIL
jgi:hypothetical protein